MKTIDYILIALVAVGAIIGVVTAIICLYIFAIYAHVDSLFSDLNERIFKEFGKLIGSQNT